MIPDPKGPLAAPWRQRKFQLLRRFPMPLELLPGSLSVSRTRCGKPSCHCAEGQGHEAWTFTFMSHGKRRVERIPKEWIDDVRPRVEAGREFLDAVREILTANAELLILARQQQPPHRR
ncbi:MAG TPA: DUF6788 family protein [Candidatus Acidoferrales bacterium]|nr:DUF6788 family protein [Candidatus Acidoferrales bacterium]